MSIRTVRTTTAVVLGMVASASPAATAASAATTVAGPAATTAETATGTLRGVVIEAFSGRPLAGATVTAGGVTLKTGADGAFTLRLPPGTWTLEARAEGHLKETQTVLVVADSERSVDVYLLDRSRLREEVTVEAPAGGAGEGPAELPVRPDQVLAVAGAADNVFRTLQTLPGVTGTEEFSSRLAVRGGEPDQNLTVMDGVEIHNPYRLFGLTSAFNPETVQRFDLQAGAFGAKYGDRLSSLLVVENRDGDAARRFGGSSALSVTDANLILEGGLPGGRSGSWLLTGRRTYYDLVADRFVDGSLPAFGDVQAKATWEMRAGRRLSLIALASRESTDARFEGDRPGEGGDFVTGVHNDLAALSFDATLGTRATSRSALSFYRNDDAIDVNAQFRAEQRRSNAPSDDQAFSLADVVFTRTLDLRDVSLRQDFLYEASGRHLLEAGFEAHLLRTAVAWDISGDRNLSEANGSSLRGGSGLPSLLDSARDSLRFGAYVQDRYQMMRRLVLEPGLRLDWSGVNGRGVLQPRLRANLRLSSRTQLRAGAGLYAQSPGYEKLIQADYFVDLTEARALSLPHARSWQAVLGVEHELGPGFVARAEAYYKSFDDLIVGRLESEAERQARVATYDFPAELADSVPAEAQITSEPSSGGAGRSYGFDLYLARRARSAQDRLSGWASYTYGRADRESYGRSLPFDYDRRHALSLVAGWRASAKLDLALTARVASGFPYTPVLGLRVNAVEDALDGDRDGNATELVPERDPAGLLVYTPDRGAVANLLTARYPAFARVDLRATFRPKGANGRWQLYLDVINVLNRDNVGSYQSELVYDPDSDRPRITESASQSIPFLPSFGVRFRF